MAVEGDPGTTVAVPTLAPSSVKEIVPVGCKELPAAAVIVAVTPTVPPEVGVAVDDVTASVVEDLFALVVTGCEVDPA
jgi:hypothetical protein